MTADEVVKVQQIIEALRDAEANSELDCEIHDHRQTLAVAADTMATMQIKLTDAQQCIHDIAAYLEVGSIKSAYRVVKNYRSKQNAEDDTE